MRETAWCFLSSRAPSGHAVGVQQSSNFATYMRQRSIHQRSILRRIEPSARTRGMRKWDRQRSSSGVPCFDRSANQLGERARWEKAFDRESSHEKQDGRFKQAELCVEPCPARQSFGGARNAVAAPAGVSARITARHGRDVDAVARCYLVDSSAFEPREEGASRAPGEWAAIDCFDFSRCLADEHCNRTRRIRHNRSDGDRCSDALATGAKRRAMGIKEWQERSGAGRRHR